MPATHQPFLYALGVAIAVHIALIFGITFSTSTPTPKFSTISTTLNHQANQQPDQAMHYAEAQQQGEDNATKAARTPMHTATTVAQHRTLLTTTGPSHAISYVPRHYTHSTPDPFAHIQGLIEHYSLLLNPNAPISAPVPTEQHQEDEFEQIAATFAHIEAAYIDAFRRTVERVGTENFPAQALAQNLVGNVRLLVAIQANGQVSKIKILSSSGHRILDEAAVQSVRLAAPFMPFDSTLSEHVSELQLIRTWQFDRQQVLSNH